jgi:hypothetical protein
MFCKHTCELVHLVTEQPGANLPALSSQRLPVINMMMMDLRLAKV